MRLGYEDAVANLFRAVTDQAAAEFPAALDALRARFGARAAGRGRRLAGVGRRAARRDRPGGRHAAVLVSPVAQLRTVVAVNERRFGFAYPGTRRPSGIADRLDFVARAEETARHAPAVIVGAEDGAGIRTSSADLRDALTKHYADPARVDLVTVDGMGHAFADEPGIEPAPQTAHAAEVDRLAVDWLRRHLP
jgi:hypothetical protein